MLEDGSSLSDHARLDTMVTVVDASTFLDELVLGDDLADRHLEASATDERGISDLLVDQVEFADVLVVSKTDLAGPDRTGRVEALLRRLNPGARLLHAHHGAVELAEVLDTGRYDPITAATAPGWTAELSGTHTPETQEYGISSVVYRAARPFHPARLMASLENWVSCCPTTRPGPGRRSSSSAPAWTPTSRGGGWTRDDSDLHVH